MDTPGNTPTNYGEQQPSARRGNTRRILLLAGLVAALALVGVGSDLLAAHFTQPKHLTNTIAANFDQVNLGVGNTPPPPPANAAAPTVGPCNCAPSKVTQQLTPTPTPGFSAPTSASGQVIVVSKPQQWLYAYQNGKLVFNTAVETARPEAYTPVGTFHISYKECSDLEWLSNSYSTGQHNANCPEHNGDGYQEIFTSPFPPTSDLYYYPTHINYAMLFGDGGIFLHDAWWHCDFGPGTNLDHWVAGCPGWPGGHIESGSHGCVGMSVDAAAWLYRWSNIGTTVEVQG